MLQRRKPTFWKDDESQTFSTDSDRYFGGKGLSGLGLLPVANATPTLPLKTGTSAVSNPNEVAL